MVENQSGVPNSEDRRLCEELSVRTQSRSWSDGELETRGVDGSSRGRLHSKIRELGKRCQDTETEAKKNTAAVDVAL